MKISLLWAGLFVFRHDVTPEYKSTLPSAAVVKCTWNMDNKNINKINTKLVYHFVDDIMYIKTSFDIFLSSPFFFI